MGMKSAKYSGNTTSRDAQIGFQIHSIIVFCDKDTLRLGQFLYNLVSEDDLETICKSRGERDTARKDMEGV